jgi:hypothetical protein
MPMALQASSKAARLGALSTVVETSALGCGTLVEDRQDFVRR